MKQTHFVAGLFLCLLLLACGVAQAANPADSLTGKEWGESGKSEKLAFLYGASNVVAIEMESANLSQKPASKFVTGWMKAFGSQTPEQVCTLLDIWYVQHPKDANRHVFDVLWNEFIVPATGR